MKKFVYALGAAIVLFTSNTSTFAIEGLQVSVQSSNAILSWPSMTNETYIAQYRQTLVATDSWVTLTNYLPAANATNLTFFVHSNSVKSPSGFGGGGGSGGGGGIPMPGGGDTNSPSTNLVFVPTGFYRVVRDGVHIYGMTNGMVLNGEVQLPIEFAVDSTDEIVGVTFYDENNSPIIGASATGTNNIWTLDWNTPMSFNGDYNIYAELEFASDDSVVSAPVTVTVNNVISFPNYFSRVFGDEMWLYAQTVPDADFQIDIYDEATNYLGSFTGTTDDGGTISFTWDLTDGEGDTFESTNFFGVFTVDTSSLSSLAKAQVKKLNAKSSGFQNLSVAKKSFASKVKTSGIRPAVSGSSASAPQLWVKEGSWTPNDYWVVACSPLTDPNQDPNTYFKESLMMLGGADGNDGGVIGTLDGNDFHGHLSPGNVPQTTAFGLADTNTRAQLLSYLSSGSPAYENFYYFGHGNNSAISAFNSAASGITSSQVADALVNVPLNDSILHAALHPYRFVFLDGCETGAGNFCESFGIPAITVSTNFFATAGVESRAFLGYKHSISFNTSQWEYRSIMLAGFLSDWESDNVDLQTCVGRAVGGAYADFQPMDSSVVIFGAYDMRLRTKTRP
jgi:hypothetical protein